EKQSDCCRPAAGDCWLSKCCSKNGMGGGKCTDPSDCCTDTATCGSGGFCCVPTGSLGCDEKSDCCQSPAGDCRLNKCCSLNGMGGGTCTEASDCCTDTATCGAGGFCCVPTGSIGCDAKSDCCLCAGGGCRVVNCCML